MNENIKISEKIPKNENNKQENNEKKQESNNNWLMNNRFQLFRPEFVKSHHTPLSSDALSRFNDPSSASEASISKTNISGSCVQQIYMSHNETNNNDNKNNKIQKQPSTGYHN